MSNNFGRNGTPNNSLPFFVAQFNDHKATIRRNPDYAKTITSLKSVFEDLESVPDKRIKICSTFPEFNGEIQVTEDLWEELLQSLTEVTILAPKITDENSPASESTNNLGSKIRTEKASRTSVQIVCKTLTGKSIPLHVEPTDTILAVKQMLFQKESLPVEQQRFIFSGQQLENERTVAEYKISKGSVLHIIMRLR